MSTPIKVVVATMAILILLTLVLMIVRPNLLGFSSSSNQTINSSLWHIGNVTGFG